MAPSACVSAGEVYNTTKFDYDKHDYLSSPFGNHGGDEVSQSKSTVKDLVLDVLKKRASDVDVDKCEAGAEDPFYVADMGEIYRQHLRWKMNMGRVKPFYGTSHQSSV